MTIDPGIKHSGGPLPGGPEDSGEVVAATPLAETAPTSSVFTVQDSISSSDAKVSVSYTSSAQHPSIEPANSKKVTTGDVAYDLADALEDPNALDGTGPAINDPTGVSPPKTSGDAAVVQLKLGEEFQKTMQSFVDKMSDSDPKKVVYEDFLKQISSALSELARIIQENSIGDAEKSKEVGNKQLEISKEKLHKFEEDMKKQEEAQAKAKEAGSKMSWMDKMSAPMGGLGIAMTCVLLVTVGPMLFLTPPVGWVGLAMLTNSLIDQVLKEKGESVNFNQNPFTRNDDGTLSFNWKARELSDQEKAEGQTGGSWKGIVEVTDHSAGCMASMFSGHDPTDPDGGPQELKFTLKFMMISTMAYSMGPAALMGGGSNLSDFVKDSGIISETAKEMKPSISDQDLMIAEMVLTMAITLTCAVTSMVLGTGATSVLQGIRVANAGTKIAIANQNIAKAALKGEEAEKMAQQSLQNARIAAAGVVYGNKIENAEKNILSAKEVVAKAVKARDEAVLAGKAQGTIDKLDDAIKAANNNLKAQKVALSNVRSEVKALESGAKEFKIVGEDGTEITMKASLSFGSKTKIGLAAEQAVEKMDKGFAQAGELTRSLRDTAGKLMTKISEIKAAGMSKLPANLQKVINAVLWMLEKILFPANLIHDSKFGYLQAPMLAASSALAVENYKAKTMQLDAQADAVRIKADMDSYMEETNALIANLKKIVQMLMEALEGSSSSLTSIGDTQRKMLDGLRNSLPN